MSRFTCISRRVTWMSLMGLIVCSAQSTAYMWGTGMNPALMCPYPYKAAKNSTSKDDLIETWKKELAKAKKALSQAEKDQRKYREEQRKHERAITGVLGTQSATRVIRHIVNRLDGNEDSSECGAAQAAATPQAPPPTPSAASPPLTDTFCVGAEGSRTDAFGDYAETGGGMKPSVCGFQPAQRLRVSGDKVMDCEHAVEDLIESIEKQRDAREKIRAAKSAIREKEKAIDERQSSIDRGETKAVACEDCPDDDKGPSAWERVLLGGLGLAAAVGGGYMSYNLQNKAIDHASRLGWPTNPALVAMPGLGLMAAGIYGAVGAGIGHGAFGCGGGLFGGGLQLGPFGINAGIHAGLNPMLGLGMGGMFGYPAGLLGSPLLGGALNMGCGPWGCPALQASLMGGLGGMMGFPGMMGMGGLGAGLHLGLGPLGMMGMGGMGMGMPGMMGMGGLGGMMGFPGMMGMGGMGGLGGMGGFDPAYMQQMQMYMQIAQRQQQDQMYRSQTIMSLQQEMYRIQMQMQQIAMGSYSYGAGASIGIGVGVGAGARYAPIDFRDRYRSPYDRYDRYNSRDPYYDRYYQGGSSGRIIRGR